MMTAGSSALVSTGVKASEAFAISLARSSVPPGPGPSARMISRRSGRAWRIASIFGRFSASVISAAAPLCCSRCSSASGPNWMKSGSAMAPNL